ncbi:hypothetical protein B0J18DRAFT_439856 [Chaetomium sp. MPI-SDFR-AT-0129]|nr:hypothetical protein B0J18DRAFT_439856 [Chaetomium sp. MPI-SDFR-AT-0129]
MTVFLNIFLIWFSILQALSPPFYTSLRFKAYFTGVFLLFSFALFTSVRCQVGPSCLTSFNFRLLSFYASL